MQISTEAGRLYGKFDNNCNPDRQYGLMFYGFCAADRRRHLIFRIDPKKEKKALCIVARIVFGVQVLLRSLSRSAIRF